MKKYIVNQCVRINLTPKPTEENKNKAIPFQFSNDLPCGEYTEDEVIKIMGKDFLNSSELKEFLEDRTITIKVETDITNKSIKSMKL